MGVSIGIMADFKILVGNSLNSLKQLPDKSVHCTITSPPYYKLRRYNAPDRVYGGSAECEHQWVGGTVKRDYGDTNKSSDKQKSNVVPTLDSEYGIKTCSECGAWLGQLGWEESPELYASHLGDIFDECKRVMTDDSCLWVNIGDSYSGSQKGYAGNGKWMDRSGTKQGTNDGSVGILPTDLTQYGYKAKDLILVPALVAQELRRRGWYLRAEIPWIVPNRMPGPWKDRPIVGHEWFYLFSKSSKSKYDGDKVLMRYTQPLDRWGGDILVPNGVSMWDEGTGQSTYRERDFRPNKDGRQRRTSDWFMDSLDSTVDFYRQYTNYLERVRNGVEDLIVDETGDPIALIVNNHASEVEHYATYNAELIKPIIEASTDEGDTVLDPFSGSGTTGVVSLEMNRNFIGCELGEGYATESEKLLKAVADRPVQSSFL